MGKDDKGVVIPHIRIFFRINDRMATEMIRTWANCPETSAGLSISAIADGGLTNPPRLLHSSQAWNLLASLGASSAFQISLEFP